MKTKKRNLGRLELYRDRKKEWRWRFVTSNGRIVADSAESYQRQRDCYKGFQALANAEEINIVIQE